MPKVTVTFAIPVAFTVLVASHPLTWVHRPCAHMSPAQSALARQVLPSPHFIEHELPQSTSVSAPFLIPSVKHVTQVDIPLQIRPPIWLHEAPPMVGGFDGMPALQRSSVH